MTVSIGGEINEEKGNINGYCTRAGVSQSTVSMILNKKYDVSFAKDTVERVENAAKDWDMSAEAENIEKEQNGRSFLLYSAQT